MSVGVSVFMCVRVCVCRVSVSFNWLLDAVWASAAPGVFMYV